MFNKYKITTHVHMAKLINVISALTSQQLGTRSRTYDSTIINHVKKHHSLSKLNVMIQHDYQKLFEILTKLKQLIFIILFDSLDAHNSPMLPFCEYSSNYLYSALSLLCCSITEYLSRTHFKMPVVPTARLHYLYLANITW